MEVSIFEKIASSTWNRIRKSAKFKISQGEESITDFNFLELAADHYPKVFPVISTPKNYEKVTGYDWEWWIGNNRVGWLRYAVQAKKIGKSHRYETLNHTVHKGKKQVSILKEYSEANQAIPLYCFCNYVDVLEIKPNSDF